MMHAWRRPWLWLLLMVSTAALAADFWNLPPEPPPAQYGNLLIDRTSTQNHVKPVVFSHWLHRRKFSCRICHTELEFNLKTNTTEITEKANQSGKFCGSSGCHDGQKAFSHQSPNCEKCHTGNKSAGVERFAELARLPKSDFGNHIDWGKALKKGLSVPARHLTVQPAADMAFTEVLTLESDWEGTPPAIFPHRPHAWLLDCSNCHPDIFNIKKKTTKHFSMIANLNGEFCGVCHTQVAFPMADCKRCHPAM